MKPIPELSRAEYDILRVLWRKGRQSVREVHNQLQNTHTWVYSTTKTIMDRMAKKKLLERQDLHGVFVYKAMVSRPAGLVRFVQFFADRVMEMDAGSVVNLFAKNETLSQAEIDELKRLLEEQEQQENQRK